LKKDALYRELLAARHELELETKKRSQYENELNTIRETEATWAKFWKEVTTHIHHTYHKKKHKTPKSYKTTYGGHKSRGKDIKVEGRR
jgi:DNA topoisomerase IA